MGNPIRVLCVFSTLDRGGAETMCMELYRHFDRSKVQLDFIKHTPNIGDFEKEIINLGGRIYEAPRFELLNLYKYFSWWNNHLDEHPEHQIIHGHFFTISAAFFRIAKKKGRTTVGHIHASTIKGLIKNLMVKRISKYADYAFACSFKSGKWVYQNREFKVLHNALDTNVFKYSLLIREKTREELGIHNELVIGTVANFSMVKNPNGLIDIFLAIKKNMPDVRLIWVGDGKLRPLIEDRILQERISDSVLLLGVRSDVPRLLQAMDIFLLPSFNEGLPVSMIEAQAAGLPCFVSNTITKEADITGLCHFLPINKPDIWASEISNLKIKRMDMSKKIREAGYEINDTSDYMQDFYLSISKSYLT